MNFETLTADDVNALDGAKREAWYAWRKGDTERAAAILNANGIETVSAPKPRTRRASAED